MYRENTQEGQKRQSGIGYNWCFTLLSMVDMDREKLLVLKVPNSIITPTPSPSAISYGNMLLGERALASARSDPRCISALQLFSSATA